MFTWIYRELLTLPKEDALVYHWSTGKDCTRMASVLILMALCVDDDIITCVYLLTNKLYDFAISRQLSSNDEIV